MSSSGTYNVVTNDQIVSSAKMQLKIEVSDDDIWFEKLVNEGVRHLDCLSLFVKKIAQLDVQDNIAKLPPGFFRLIGLRTGTPGNCGLATYVELDFIVQCGCSPQTWVQPAVNLFEIQNGYIYFHPNPTTVDPVTNEIVPPVPIESAVIAYFGMNVDDTGLYQVYDHYERALTAYVCWRYCQQNFEKYPAAIRAEYNAEWITQKKWIKSIEQQNNFRYTRKQIAEWVNAIIVDKVWSV